MVEFFSDLKSILGVAALKRVGRKALEDDCLGLAGQLTYFTLLSLFPFLIVHGLRGGPRCEQSRASVLETLTERTGGFLAEDAVGLLTDYIDRTLRGRSSGALLFAVLLTLGSGSAASQAVIKAANRAYEVRETRPFRRIWTISMLMISGFALLVVALALVAFSPEIGGHVQRLTGLPDIFLTLWGVLRWALAFLAVTLALAVLYYLAPNADLPFKWITPGGFVDTLLILVSGVGLRFYVAKLASMTRSTGSSGPS